jgi:hypothetical protein
VEIFYYVFCKLYARLSLMLFIAPLISISLSTRAPEGIVLMNSTSGRMDMILGCALVYVLDLILCRSLNSKFQK